MNRLGRWTIPMLLTGTLMLSGGLFAWGQGGNPPASTTESGTTSGRGMTAVEQTYGGDAEEQIKSLHEQGRQAALKNDASFLETHLANQYLEVGADGRLRTKAEALKDLKSGNVKYEAISERDVKVNTFGNNAAVVNSTASIKGRIEGKPVNGEYRATSMYVKERGHWREVAFQLTPMTNESK